MIPNVILALAALVYLVGCWQTYAEHLRDHWWYVPLGVLLGACAGALWIWAAKAIGDKDKMYAFTLIWDSMMMAIYYGLPILLFGARPDRWTTLGLFLILAGAIIIKVKH